MLPAAALLDKRQPHKTNQQDKEAATNERSIRAAVACSTGTDGHAP